MSVKLMGMAFDLDLNFRDKFVLIALADHADHNGNHAYPSVDTLAKKTSLSEKSVRVALQALESKGLIRKQKLSTPRFPAWYQITIEGGSHYHPETGVRVVATTTLNGSGVNQLPPRVVATTTEPSLTVLREQPSEENHDRISVTNDTPDGHVTPPTPHASPPPLPPASPSVSDRIRELRGKGRFTRGDQAGIRQVVQRYGEERVRALIDRDPAAIASADWLAKYLERHLQLAHPEFSDPAKAARIARALAAFAAHPDVGEDLP